jgi:hypothetical protein
MSLVIGRHQPIALRNYALWCAAIIAAGLLWRSEALNAGFMVDDYPQIAIRDGFYPVARPPFDLFSFSHGASAENAALRAAGIFPWWSHPELRIAMLRPLASLLLVLDGALFGDDAHAYHVHSALWWVAMNAVLAVVLRRALPSWAAPLALALFVADEAHASLLSWIAMRNAIVASTFALLGLWAQLRARDGGARWAPPLALTSYVLALAAGEYALAFFGYALLLELGGGQRPAAYARRLLGPALLLAGYLALRGRYGFGAAHSSIYLEPGSSPFAFARAAVPRFLVLSGDLVAAIPASAWTWGIRWPLGFLQRGLVPKSWVFDFDAGRVLLQWLGWAALALGVVIGRRCLRAGREHGVDLRWLVLGTPLAVLPLLCSFPENRLLVPAQLGWAAMLAYLVFDAVTRNRALASGGLALGVVASGALALYHVLLPLTQARGDVRDTSANAAAMRAAILAPALDPLLASKARVFLLGAADPTTSIYLPLVRRLHHRPAPRACLLLSSCAVPQILHRVSPRAFTLERTFAGYTAADTYAAFFSDRPLQRGDVFTLEGMRVQVERTQAGRPLRVRYEFDSPLDDGSSVILLQTANGLVPLSLPAPGNGIFVPAPLLGSMK